MGLGAGQNDGKLLVLFAVEGNQEAFAELVNRHGSMVRGVARRLLADAHEAEDVAQAAFLALAREARRLRRDASLAGWLHTATWRLALDVQKARIRRARREERAMAEAERERTTTDETANGMRETLDAALNALPERYRHPLLLVHFDGLSSDEAALRLAIKPGALRVRLTRGREMLRQRLVRRGVPVGSVGVLTGLLSAESGAATLPPTFVASTVSAATGAAAVSASVDALTEGVLRAMFIVKVQSIGLTAAACLVVVGTGVIVAKQLTTPATTTVVVRTPDSSTPAGATDGWRLPAMWSTRPYWTHMPNEAIPCEKGVAWLFAMTNGTTEAVVLQAVRLETGAPVWTLPMPQSFSVSFLEKVGDYLLFRGGGKGTGSRLYCVDGRNGRLLWDRASWDVFVARGDTVVSGVYAEGDGLGRKATLWACEIATGRLFWEVSNLDVPRFPEAMTRDHVLTGRGSTVHAYQIDNGALAWTHEPGRIRREAIAGWQVSIATDLDAAYVVAQQDVGLRLSRLNAKGHPVWSQPAKAYETIQCQDGDWIYVTTPGELKAMRKADGETGWSLDLPEGNAYCVFAANGGWVLLAEKERELIVGYAHDNVMNRGRFVWKHTLSGRRYNLNTWSRGEKQSLRYARLVHDGAIHLATDRGILRIRLSDGAQSVVWESASILHHPTLTEQGILAVDNGVLTFRPWRP